MTGVDGFLVIPHCKVGCGFSDMSFDEIRFQGNCFIAVLQTTLAEKRRGLGKGGWLVTLIASGKEASLIYAAARFAYPLGSSGARLIASVYAFTAPGKSPALNNLFPCSLASSAFTGSMYDTRSFSPFAFST